MICDKCINKEVCKLYDPKSNLVGCIFFQSVHKRGEWIIVKDERYGDNVKCPFCGKELVGTDLNFCCKCGAELIGSEKQNGGAE